MLRDVSLRAGLVGRSSEAVVGGGPFGGCTRVLRGRREDPAVGERLVGSGHAVLGAGTEFLNCFRVVDMIIVHDHADVGTDIRHFGQEFKDGNEEREVVVGTVIKPSQDWNGIVRLKEVRRG